MSKQDKQQVSQFIQACGKVARYGLSLCSSGNLSWRVGTNEMLVKSNRAWMSEMKLENVARCRISDGKPLNGIKPSAEIGFHSGILRARPDVNVVLHFQSPYATAISCRKGKPNFNIIPELPFYIGEVAYVPFYLPGSTRLATSVISAMKKHDIAVLRNHGQVTVGGSFNEAIQNAVFFEIACGAIVRNGGDCTTIPPRLVSILTV